jgi:predicted NAD/FAD-binding protein
VTRDVAGVQITVASGEEQHYDKIVFATTPGQVLKLLQDPTENELKRFKAWQDNVINTMIHTDTSIYKHFGVAYLCCCTSITFAESICCSRL